MDRPDVTAIPESEGASRGWLPDQQQSRDQSKSRHRRSRRRSVGHTARTSGAGDGRRRLTKPLVVLLRGLYQPVVHGPDLGLSTVNLSDGSYFTTKIYPVSGVPGGQTNVLKAIGDFYTQFTGNLCAYDLLKARLR